MAANKHEWTATVAVNTDDAGTIMDAFAAFAAALDCSPGVVGYDIELLDSTGDGVLEFTKGVSA